MKIIFPIFFAFLATFLNNSHDVLNHNIVVKIIVFIIGSFFGFIGFIVGEKIRDFAIPDSVYTTGGFSSIVGIKLFWMFVPQIIGTIISTVIIESMLFKIL